MRRDVERFDTVVIGGGQSGLSMGYHLKKLGISFVILDANDRVGHAWRSRWDSLRLFTPGRYCALDGMPFTGDRNHAPTKDEFASYLEAYAERFALPVRTDCRVERLKKEGNRFVVTTRTQRFEADRVIVATGAFRDPKVPAFAADLDPRIVQLHSVDYRGPAQLTEGGILLVGAGNSGADIAMDVVRTHPTWLAGRHPGNVPFHIDTFVASRILLRIVRFVGHRVLNLGTPIGRKVLPKMAGKGSPLIRIKPKELVAAGVERVHAKVTGVEDGLPMLDDGTVLDVANIIWCTGFNHTFPWIDLPVFDASGSPLHERGIVGAEPGLYFLGLEFQYAASSDVITGVGRDARYIAKDIAKHNTSAGRGRRAERIAARV
jgi:putative flavoprotein involved in K+ transport